MSERWLFDDEPAVEPRHLARRGDPETSHEAARHMVESGRLGGAQEIALAEVRAHPGSTAAELEDRSIEYPGAIRKRLPELRRMGLVGVGATRACEVTGRRAQTWWPT